MHKYLVFDLDGTLAPIGKAASQRTVSLLQTLEKGGQRIVLCSGKPTFYLCGFARQLGLSDPILAGENGAAIQFGIDLPPKDFRTLPFDRKKSKNIAKIKQKIDEVCGDKVWYQPNDVVLTPFFFSQKENEEIARVLNENRELLSGLSVYPQCDCYDILPDEISKKNGIAFLASLLKAESKDFVTVGDGINDIPMFEFADCSIGIGRKEWDKTDLCFLHIEEALEYIIKNQI